MSRNIAFQIEFQYRKERYFNMKTCVSTYSFGKYVESLGIYGVIDKATEMGFDGIEFVESGWSNVDLCELEKIGAYAAEKGLARASFCVGADFINGSGGDTAAEVERFRRIDLTDKQREDIFWNNAVRFLHLEEEAKALGY